MTYTTQRAFAVWLLLLSLSLQASAQDKDFYFSYKVLDRIGTPVPNARLTLLAVDEEGSPFGTDAQWSTGIGTNLDGLAEMGLASPPKRRPGKLQLVAEHPSIGKVRKTVPWSAVLHDVRPLASFSEPLFVLKSDEGPGLEVWRETAAQRAPALVESLMKTKHQQEVDSLTAQLATGEMMSIPPLAAALQDYGNPLRRRLVRALLLTWNGCRGQGPLDESLKPKVSAIYIVNMYVAILAERPQVKPSFQGYLPREIANEIAWVVKDLPVRIAAAREKGNTNQAIADEAALARVKELQRQLLMELDEDF